MISINFYFYISVKLFFLLAYFKKFLTLFNKNLDYYSSLSIK